MRVILSCEPNGFGPVSKLTAIARLLPDAERIFVGDAGALEFARRNPDCFERYLTIAELQQTPDLVDACDFAMVVMEPDVTFELLQAGLPVYLFDSLIEFWVLPNGVAPLATAARKILSASSEDARAIFHAFSIHERKLLAHMIATRSFAQNFPGVPQRIGAMANEGFGEVRLLGSIIDLPPSEETPRRVQPDGSWSMLINLGGVENFAIRFNENDYIIDLTEKWAAQFLQDTPSCRAITICCGRYRQADTRAVGHGTLTRRFAARDEFMGLLEHADVVLSAAGRTTLHEAIHLGKAPILLPEQHHNQYCNLASLAPTRLGELSVTLSDVVALGDLPDDDLAGTLQIIEGARQVLHEAALFQRFDALLRARIAAFRALEPSQLQAIVDDVAAYLGGADFGTTVRDLARQEKPRLRYVQPGVALIDG